MHRRVEWMTPADVSVLNYLYASRTVRDQFSVQTPKTVAVNTGYSRKTTSARCQVLADHGLVDQLERGEYRLSEYGRKVLENEIALEQLDEGGG